MKIAIHQPNYLPWLGFFYKMALCDTFVLLDDVEHTQRSYTRRVYIRRGKWWDEKTYLSVPLKRHSDYALIKELRIDYRQPWQNRQLNQIRNTYSGSTGFAACYPRLEQWLNASRNFDYLSDFNSWLILELAQLLGLQTVFHKASDLPVKEKGSEYNLAIVQYLGGTVYWSGEGGRKYQNKGDFEQAGIELRYTDFQQRPYQQAQGDWLPGLSIVDYLMNHPEQQWNTTFRGGYVRNI